MPTRVAVSYLREGRDQLAHVRQRQGVPAGRAVHRDRGELTRPVHQDVLELHRDLLAWLPAYDHGPGAPVPSRDRPVLSRDAAPC